MKKWNMKKIRQGFIFTALFSLLLAATAFAEDVSLQIGDNGEGVKTLQEHLISLGYLQGNADGDFGAMTEAAVKDYQKAQGLEETGIADDGVLELLDAEISEMETQFRQVLTSRLWLWMYQAPNVVRFYEDGTFQIYSYSGSYALADYQQQEADGNWYYYAGWLPDPEYLSGSESNFFPYELEGTIVTLEFPYQSVRLDYSGLAGASMENYTEVQQYSGDYILYEYEFANPEPMAYPYIFLAVGEAREISAYDETAETLVSERFRYDYTEGDNSYSCVVPQINLTGNAIDKLNDQLYYSMHSEIQTMAFKQEYGNRQMEDLIETSYEWYQWEDVLSLVIYRRYGGPWAEYDVYNISISQQRLLSREEVLQAAGYDETTYTDQAKDALAAAFLEANSFNVENGNDTSSGYLTYQENTLSEENIQQAMPYLNSDGELCMIGMVYVYGVQVSDQWTDLALQP